MQSGANVASGAVDSRSDGAHRDMGGFGDLLVGEVAPHVRQERISILRGELSKRGGHLRTERLGLDPV